MNLVRYSISIFLLLTWVLITNYKLFPLNSFGALFTYKSGLLGIAPHTISDTNINLGKDVSIKVDSFGIPYIYAKEDQDVAFGLGYMHAKDRYFQMELMRSIVLGDLSSIFGKVGIESDGFWKPYDFKKKSKEMLSDYKVNSPEVFAYLSNYSEGINAYLKHCKIDDPLYKIFNLKPKEWKPEYSFLVAWYMCRTLSYFDYHLERQEILDKVPLELLNVLYPGTHNNARTILPPSYDHEVRANSLEIPLVDLKNQSFIMNHLIVDVGSNNWVINNTKSINNRTFLANDPHMILTLPGAFYESGLIGDQINVYGFSVPGIPLILSGHNSVISWGITNGEWDLVDSYLLETLQDSVYNYSDNWVPFEEKDYEIFVRGKGKHNFKIKSTVHGRVIKSGDYYYAQKWYPAEKKSSIRAIYDLMGARNYDEFRSALKNYNYPPQNFIYGDAHNNIGIVCAGNLPSRPIGFDGGMLDGTKAPISDEFGFNELEISNPERGYLFSANQLPIQNTRYFGAHWHKDDYRVRQIDQLLKNENDWNEEKIMAMQLDDTDISYFHLKSIINTLNVDITSKPLRELFENWDGRMKGGSEKALHYELLRKSVEVEAARFAKNELKVLQAPSMKSFLNYLGQGINVTGQSYSLKGELLSSILSRADSLITSVQLQDLGADEYLGSITVNNISFLPGFHHSIPSANGNKNTINMNGAAHPTFRSIYQIGENSISGYTIMAGGQSGKLNSLNYVDQLKLWSDGEYKITQFSNRPEYLENIVYSINFKE